MYISQLRDIIESYNLDESVYEQYSFYRAQEKFNVDRVRICNEVKERYNLDVSWVRTDNDFLILQRHIKLRKFL